MEDYESYSQRARLLTSIHAAKEPEAGTSTSPVEFAEGGELLAEPVRYMSVTRACQLRQSHLDGHVAR